MQRNNDGRVLYHSLQTRVQKRFSNGMQLVANYTHSKSMQYLQTSSVNVRHNNRTVSAIDIPNMFNVFLTYQMPFGRGRTWGRDWARWLDAVAGGWTMAFTTHYQSGDPMTVEDTNGMPIPIGDPNMPGGVKQRLGDQIDPKTKLPLNPYFNRDVWIRVANFKISPEPALWSWLRGPTAVVPDRHADQELHDCGRLEGGTARFGKQPLQPPDLRQSSHESRQSGHLRRHHGRRRDSHGDLRRQAEVLANSGSQSRCDNRELRAGSASSGTSISP